VVKSVENSSMTVNRIAPPFPVSDTGQPWPSPIVVNFEVVERVVEVELDFVLHSNTEKAVMDTDWNKRDSLLLDGIIVFVEGNVTPNVGLRINAELKSDQEDAEIRRLSSNDDIITWSYDTIKELKTDKNPEQYDITFFPEVDEKRAGFDKTLTVLPVFKWLKDSKDDRVNALDYVIWKYSNVFGAQKWSAMTYVDSGFEGHTDISNNVEIGNIGFRSENYLASVIGHENFHCGQDLSLRTLGTFENPVIGKVSLYWQAVMEIPAYGWELDHADELGLSDSERSVIQTALNVFIQQMQDNEESE